MKIDKRTLCSTVEKINLLCETARKNLADGNWRKYDEQLWKLIEQLQNEAGEGLVPGKHLKWSVCDGYAHYIVLEVYKNYTYLAFLDYMDGYSFPGVFTTDNGRLAVPTPVAKEAARWQDATKKLFSKK